MRDLPAISLRAYVLLHLVRSRRAQSATEIVRACYRRRAAGPMSRRLPTMVALLELLEEQGYIEAWEPEGDMRFGAPGRLWRALAPGKRAAKAFASEIRATLGP